MKVDVLNKQSTLRLSKPSVKALVKEVIAFEKKKYDEVAIHFVTTEAISQLHLQFFDDPSPTDCISFPMEEEDFLGDVFVCPETAIAYCLKEGSDPYGETALYVIHGLLHLMGYDDRLPNQKAQMRRAEKRHLRNLENVGLWLHP